MSDAKIPTTFSDLDEPPVNAVFDLLPLRKLLRIDEVCRLWKEMKPGALRRRRRLIIVNNQLDLPVLHFGFYSMHNRLKYALEEKKKLVDGSSTSDSKFIVRLDRHVLYIERSELLPEGTLKRVKELLPNLTVFQLVQNYGTHQELGKVAQLLYHYRHQLEEVTILFWGEPDKRQGQSDATVQRSYQQMFALLMASLDSMTKLRSLDLDFKARQGFSVAPDKAQLVKCSLPSVVGCLKTLKFTTLFNDVSDRVVDSRLLQQILIGMRDGNTVKSKATSSKQEHFELFFPDTPLTLRTLISLGPGPVAAGLRSVEISGNFSGDSKAEYKALARLARQSPHLQSLTLSLKSSSIWRLVESLVSLKELVHLFIILCSVSLPQEVSIDVHQLPVLPSVKSLKLSLAAFSHRDYEQLHLEKLFPSLQMVEWTHLGFRCIGCGFEVPVHEIISFIAGQIDGTQFKAAYSKQLSECLRLARMAAFSRLPQLTNLWAKVRPFNHKLPFKEQMFTSRQSLGRRTQFVDFEKEDEFNLVIYNN